MKFLIAGLGSIGRRHLRNLLALGQQDILLYRSGRATLPDAELDGFPVETDLQAALAHQPDAVIVSNPTALHLEVAIPAARAGCHLLLEKPISHTLERVAELEQACAASGSRVLTGFQFRFNPGLEKIEDLLNAGTIGRVVSCQAHWGEYLPNWHPWEDYRHSYSARPDLGGGVVLTLCHPLDYLRGLLGEVTAVSALTGSQGGLGLSVEDSAIIGLQFASGALGGVHLDYIQQPAAHRLELIGTTGTLRWDNTDSAVDVLRPGQPQERYAAPAGFERNTMFVDMMEHFIAVLRGETEPRCNLTDGRRALEIALAVKESAASGRRIDFAETNA